MTPEGRGIDPLQWTLHSKSRVIQGCLARYLINVDSFRAFGFAPTDKLHPQGNTLKPSMASQHGPLVHSASHLFRRHSRIRVPCCLRIQRR